MFLYDAGNDPAGIKRKVSSRKGVQSGFEVIPPDFQIILLFYIMALIFKYGF